MKRGEKRAVSPVIGTILLILMTIVAVGLIWRVAMPLIYSGAGELSANCIGVDLRVEMSGGATCYDSAAKEVSVVVSRGSKEFELDDIQVVLKDSSGDSKSVFVKEANVSTELPAENGQESYVIDADDVGIVPVKAAVAPRLLAGETTKLCGVTSEVVLKECE